LFLYVRKSTDREDRQILGTDSQKRLLLEHAGRASLQVVDIYVENQSAYKTGRPLFAQMLQRLEKGEADGILTYHLTRLARNSFDGGRLIYMMDQGIVHEIVTPEKSYTNNGDDKFMMQIHFAMAKKSSDDTSQFVRRDVVSKLLKGEYPGMVPPGYLNVNRDGHITKHRDDPEKYLLLLKLGRPLRREEIDPVDGPLVARLFEEAAIGTRSLAALRDFSYRLGLRSREGKKLSKTALWNLLTNPYFYGVIRYNDRLYTEKIQHDPLISKMLFDRVQEALGRSRKGKYRRHLYAFGGCVMACGDCGCPITAERQKGRVYYHCTKSRGGCPQKKWTREDVVAKQFGAIFSGLQIPQSYIDYALSKLRQSHATKVEYAGARRHKLQSQVNACHVKQDSLLQLKISPANLAGALLNDAEYLAQKTKIQEELDMIQHQLAADQQGGEEWIDACERFFAFTQKLAGTFAEASAEEKQAALFLVCSKLTLGNQLVTAEFREPFATLAAFPLAGQGGKGQFEPHGRLKQAEEPEIVESWLGILDVIRTFALTHAPTGGLDFDILLQNAKQAYV
jgi:DNA invertase Pin-like site-specific DNA recombinase